MSDRSIPGKRLNLKPGIDYVDFGPADLSFDLECNPHPRLKTLQDCREHVKKELEGSHVRIM